MQDQSPAVVALEIVLIARTIDGNLVNPQPLYKALNGVGVDLGPAVLTGPLLVVLSSNGSVDVEAHQLHNY